MTDLRGGLAPGFNKLLGRDDDPIIGLDFGIHRLAAGETLRWADPTSEAAWLVLSGRGQLEVEQIGYAFDRRSWIEQPPTVAHAAAGASFEVRAETPCEIVRLATANRDPFAPRLYQPGEIESEHRGKGLWGDTAYRIVRCAFDRRNAPPQSKLVLGEVVNFPGKWSSYPPHHHAQPEIYYYRFAPEHGYGHGELGDEVFMLRNHDLLKITGGRDHSQVSAPGYHMYYLWAIRHLDDDPYEGFEFNPEHRWLLDERT